MEAQGDPQGKSHWPSSTHCEISGKEEEIVFLSHLVLIWLCTLSATFEVAAIEGSGSRAEGRIFLQDK